MNKFEIANTPTDGASYKLKIQRMFNETKSIWFQKIFIYLYSAHPSSREDLIGIITKMEGVCLDKSTVHGLLSKLICWGLAAEKTIQEADGDTDIDNKIQSKHKQFVQGVPLNFRESFNKRKYYYVTILGEEFIPFVAKKMGLEVKDGHTKKV